MNSHSWDLKELYCTAAHKILHDKLYEVIDPLLEIFTPSSPLKAFPPPETDFLETVISKADDEAKAEVTPPPPVTDIATISRT